MRRVLAKWFLVAGSVLALSVCANATPARRSAAMAQVLAPADQTLPIAVQHMADWVKASGDNQGLPFIIVDKPAAKVAVFDSNGQLLGSDWALVGLARGDDSAPGVGTMPLTAITPDIRTTPAGRFVTTLGHDLGPLDVLWVDYPDAISLHRVINTNPAERRLERIISPLPAEHRISFGCINVPAKFFDRLVEPNFKDTRGVAYILPEVKSMRAVFPNYYDPQPAFPPQAAADATPVRYRAGSVEDHDPAAIVH